jgi:hypothetical protein
VKTTKTSLNESALIKTITPGIVTDKKSFLKGTKYTVWDLLEQHRGSKIKLGLHCKMVQTEMTYDAERENTERFWSETMDNYIRTSIGEMYRVMCVKMLEAFASYL